MRRGQLKQVSVLWALFWGAVAVDSALTHRRTMEAVRKAEDADPYLEEFEGPPAQDGRVTRGLLWQRPTLSRLRQLCRRAEWWKKTAPWIALAGPPAFFVLARSLGGRRKSA
jgi:hypothetical protein